MARVFEPLLGGRVGRGGPGDVAQEEGDGAEDHRGDQCGRPVGQADVQGQPDGERDGGAGVEGDRAGRGVQQGGAALPPGLLAQFLADGLPCHLGELVDQVSVQMLQVIDAVHALRVPAVTGA